MIIDPHNRSQKRLKRREKKKRDYHNRVGPLVERAKQGDKEATRKLERMGIVVKKV